jgi:hypothetical protein
MVDYMERRQPISQNVDTLALRLEQVQLGTDESLADLFQQNRFIEES